MTEKPFLQVEGLVKHYPVGGGLLSKPSGHVRAVDGVTLTIDRPGETLGLAGESGCGKSTLGRLLLRLIEPSAGTIAMDGTSVSALKGEQLRQWRQHAQMVFQDPYWSLNPRMRIGASVIEPLAAHRTLSGSERTRKAAELLELVGLGAEYAQRYPHELSGGQRQRVGIARALSVQPRLLVLDEPTSALDVSVQAQILRLLTDLQQRLGLTYLFISHDLAVMEYLCDRVAVMYLGEVVETGTTEELFGNPLHPYTRALLASRPEPDPSAARERMVLRGGVPDPKSPPSGCRFHPRCPYAVERCRLEAPALRTPPGGHQTACHFAGEI
ncbi:MAG: peptide transporter substrate-binding protein [Firmicutes bacterium]|nr:peptide transporter substrate-binding protein [Bacillota bacterium]